MHCGNAKVNVSREQIVIEGVMSALDAVDGSSTGT